MPQALIDFAKSKITSDMQTVLDASYLAKNCPDS
jgi:hypothetical protein